METIILLLILSSILGKLSAIFLLLAGEGHLPSGSTALNACRVMSLSSYELVEL